MQQRSERIRRITPARKQQFLEHVRQGMNRKDAAAQVGETGTKFRAMVREGCSVYDPVFAAAYAEALEEGRELVAESLAAEGLRRQLDDPELKSDRGLHNERIFRDPAYRAAHRQQVEHTGKDGDKLEVVLAFLPPPPEE